MRSGNGPATGSRAVPILSLELRDDSRVYTFREESRQLLFYRTSYFVVALVESVVPLRIPLRIRIAFAPALGSAVTP